MKALRSELAKRLLADPIAREGLRQRRRTITDSTGQRYTRVIVPAPR